MINASTGNIRIMNSIEMLSWSLTFFLLSAPRTDPTIGIPYNPYRRVLSRYGAQGGPISGSPGQHPTSAKPHPPCQAPPRGTARGAHNLAGPADPHPHPPL